MVSDTFILAFNPALPSVPCVTWCGDTFSVSQGAHPPPPAAHCPDTAPFLQVSLSAPLSALRARPRPPQQPWPGPCGRRRPLGRHQPPGGAEPGPPQPHGGPALPRKSSAGLGTARQGPARLCWAGLCCVCCAGRWPSRQRRWRCWCSGW